MHLLHHIVWQLNTVAPLSRQHKIERAIASRFGTNAEIERRSRRNFVCDYLMAI